MTDLPGPDQWNQWPPTPLTATQVELSRLRVAVTERVGLSVADSLRLEEVRDLVAQHLVYHLSAHVLAEQLPPHHVEHHVRVRTGDPRWATWWDHFKDTYRHRWWMRWRTWRVSYVRTPVTVDRTIRVDVRDHWTYPRAQVALPSDRFGSPVLVSMVGVSDDSDRAYWGPQ